MSGDAMEQGYADFARAQSDAVLGVVLCRMAADETDSLRRSLLWEAAERLARSPQSGQSERELLSALRAAKALTDLLARQDNPFQPSAPLTGGWRVRQIGGKWYVLDPDGLLRRQCADRQSADSVMYWLRYGGPGHPVAARLKEGGHVA